MTIRSLPSGWLFLFVLSFVSAPLWADDAKPSDSKNTPISYDKQIRPIFQANCQGCHQPAKAKSAYIMTNFEKMLSGGDTGEKAIVPGHPEKSHLFELITPENGKAKMPADGRPPLADSDIDLIKRWIAEGAKNDSPPEAKPYSTDNPPIYTRPPVISAIDYSSDGKWLAIAGFHEVLLYSADATKLEARLIGMSERVQSLRFSPNGEYLAVAGGLPARLGEIQIWKIADKKLVLSAPFGFDTLYGVSWSPDGAKVAFGCADNTVRAIDVKTGQQVLQQGSHSDWPLDTCFNPKGTHVVSVSRDMTSKLTEVATQRFIDNITSITPGALRGGIGCVVSHPTRDEIVVGGADGKPKVYRIFRNVERKIGDDSNLIRELPALPGRVNSVAISKDGKRIAAVSSLDTVGTLQIYGYDFDPTLPEELKKIMAKEVTARSAEEKKKIDKYHTDAVKLLGKATTEHNALFCVAFDAKGETVAAAGADGQLRLFEAATGKLLKTVGIAPKIDKPSASTLVAAERPQEPVVKESLPKGATLVGLETTMQSIRLTGPFDYAQLLVFGKIKNSDGGQDVVDVTRQLQYQPSEKIIAVDPTGLIRPLAQGNCVLNYQLGQAHGSVQVLSLIHI